MAKARASTFGKGGLGHRAYSVRILVTGEELYGPSAPFSSILGQQKRMQRPGQHAYRPQEVKLVGVFPTELEANSAYDLAVSQEAQRMGVNPASLPQRRVVIKSCGRHYGVESVGIHSLGCEVRGGRRGGGGVFLPVFFVFCVHVACFVFACSRSCSCVCLLCVCSSGAHMRASPSHFPLQECDVEKLDGPTKFTPPFMWNGENYLLKVLHDLDFLAGSEELVGCLGPDFPLKDNPLMLAPPGYKPPSFGPPPPRTATKAVMFESPVKPFPFALPPATMRAIAASETANLSALGHSVAPELRTVSVFGDSRAPSAFGDTRAASPSNRSVSTPSLRASSPSPPKLSVITAAEAARGGAGTPGASRVPPSPAGFRRVSISSWADAPPGSPKSMFRASAAPATPSAVGFTDSVGPSAGLVRAMPSHPPARRGDAPASILRREEEAAFTTVTPLPSMIGFMGDGASRRPSDVTTLDYMPSMQLSQLSADPPSLNTSRDDDQDTVDTFDLTMAAKASAAVLNVPFGVPNTVVSKLGGGVVEWFGHMTLDPNVAAFELAKQMEADPNHPLLHTRGPTHKKKLGEVNMDTALEVVKLPGLRVGDNRVLGVTSLPTDELLVSAAVAQFGGSSVEIMDMERLTSAKAVLAEVCCGCVVVY